MIRLLSFDTAREAWFEEASSLYQKKIAAFYKFEKINLKSPTKDASQKAEQESNLLLTKTKGRYIILADEKGKNLDSSRFSKMLVDNLESGNRNIDFIVGGAFGVSDTIREESNQVISLAPFVMNHLVAQVVLMEQIYRAFSIWKGLPYHNN